MKPALALALVLAALGFTIGLIGLLSAAHADTPTLADKLERSARHLQAPKEPQTDMHALALAIDTASHGDRVVAAALLTTGWVETALADRIRLNKCRPHECDSRRAWGSFQRHKNGNNAAIWGSPDITVQATDAARAMRSAYYTAKAAHAPFPEGMFRIYGGRRPDAQVPRESLRVAIFKQVQREIAP